LTARQPHGSSDLEIPCSLGFATGQATGLLDALGERTDLEEVVLYTGMLPPGLHPAAQSGRMGDERLPDEIARIFAVGVEPNLGTPGAQQDLCY
jgi:hypothetical protein